MNYDMTFCLSTECPKKETCSRNYNTLIELNIHFDRLISVAEFYKASDIQCNYYIKLK